MATRIRIFVGAYGSGKSEVAISYTLELRKQNENIAIADLDLVNPYFRSREMREAFAARGIHTVAPEGALSAADLPVIIPEVRGFIENRAFLTVLDVGGDDAGARALAQFVPFIEADPDGYDMFFVVNDRRPWTNTVEGLRDTLRRVTGASHLAATALVSNPNLGDETTLEVVRQGHRTLCEAGRELGLPVAFLAVKADLVPELSSEDTLGVPVLALERQLFPPWHEAALRHAPYTDPRSRILVREMLEKEQERTRSNPSVRAGVPSRRES